MTFAVGTKVVYDGTDPSTFGIEAGAEGYVIDERPLMPEGTVVAEFVHPVSGNMFRQEVNVDSLETAD